MTRSRLVLGFGFAVFASLSSAHAADVDGSCASNAGGSAIAELGDWFSGLLHTEPATVLAKKRARLDAAVVDLETQARATRYMRTATMGKVDKFLDVYDAIEKVERLARDVESYAEAKHLAKPDLRGPASRAVVAGEWHAQTAFQIRGLYVDARRMADRYEAGLASYRSLVLRGRP